MMNSEDIALKKVSLLTVLSLLPEINYKGASTMKIQSGEYL